MTREEPVYSCPELYNGRLLITVLIGLL